MLFRRVCSIILFTLLVSFSVFAEESTIQLKSLNVKTNITGQVAQTEVILELYNPNNRVLEYELDFPLNHSQKIVGFALDVNKQFIDAVAVEKPKAESVFEDVVRRNIDPALLKKTSGDNYKIRVYPINPGSSRKVKITLFQYLNSVEDGYSYVLDSVGRFEKAGSVSATVIVSEVQPISTSSCFGGFIYRYYRNSHSFIASSYASNVSLKGNILQVTVPKSDEDFLSAYEYDGTNYFFYQTEYEVESAISLDFQNEPLLILWDASLSEEENRKDNINFLSEFFKRNKNIMVTLGVFRDVQDDFINFTVMDGNWNELRKCIESIIYDGSASYDFMKDLMPSKNVILFSDGNDLYSKYEDNFIPAENVFCVCSGVGSNIRKLQKIYSNSRGSVIELKNASDTSLVKLDILEKPSIYRTENVSDVFSELRDNTLILVGIVEDVDQEVTVFLNGGNQVSFNLENCFIINCLPKIWADYKINDLLDNEKIHKSEISRLSKKFSVPTDTMSLIVLESAKDYFDYGIDPPQLFKEEYDKLLKSKEKSYDESLVKLKKEWDSYVTWWKTDFPKDDPVYEVNEKSKSSPVLTNNLEVFDGYEEYADFESYEIPEMVELSSMRANYESVDSYDDYVVEESASSISEASEKIYLQKWNGDSEISERIRSSNAEDAYYIYLDARDDFRMSAGFYLECSELLAEKGETTKALRVLSTLAEIAGEDRSVLRLLANKLNQLEQYEISENIFRQVLEISPNESQSYLDLGHSLHGQGKDQEALETMYKVISSSNMRYFPGILLITLKEINAIIHTTDGLDVSFMDPYFIADLPLDLRISLSWDTDNTDIDLHVVDPNNEETYYAHKQSYQGGLNSPDNVSGFGPEDYSLKVAKKGTYRVEVNFYGNNQQKISDGTHIYLDFYTGWGTLKQQKKSIVLKLKDRGSRIYVGEIQV